MLIAWLIIMGLIGLMLVISAIEDPFRAIGLSALLSLYLLGSLITFRALEVI